MAVAERAFMQSYENSEYRYDYFSYSQGNSEHRREEAGEERKRIKRTRERPQPKTYTETNPQGLTGKELRLLMAVAVFVGMLLIGVLVLNAYAVNIQCNINKLMKENMTMENEIDTLNMKIDSSTSIEQIESYAMDELKMSYPKSNQCIYLTKDAQVADNFSSMIKEKAYE